MRRVYIDVDNGVMSQFMEVKNRRDPIDLFFGKIGQERQGQAVGCYFAVGTRGDESYGWVVPGDYVFDLFNRII